jgi:DNA-binding FadR family transcriptional regulator
MTAQPGADVGAGTGLCPEREMEIAKPLRGPALSEAIRSYIKEFILRNHLKPGDQLPPEPFWMEELAVGRSSVREAIKALQSLGIVEIRRGNGLYVRQTNFDPILESLSYNMRFDPRMFAEVFQTRVWLESAVIEAAVAQITDEDIDELDAILHEWARRLEVGESHVALDEEFHRVLYRVLNNQTLIKLFEVFWIVFRTLDIEAIRETDPVLGLQEHVEILDAVRHRDAAQARERLVDHFSHVQGRIQRAIEHN